MSNPYLQMPTASDATQRAQQIMLSVLGCLRALYHLHQNAHWMTKRLPYYGDHLLYQRLYEGIAEEVENVAERLIGVYGGSVDVVAQADLITRYLGAFDAPDVDLVERSLVAEQHFQRLLRRAYDDLDEVGKLTLGVDDLLQATASAHDVHLYLLQQRHAGQG